jgi:hypothetical protein
MSKEKNIEDILMPDRYKAKYSKRTGEYKFKFLDEELDPYEVSVDSDGIITIDTRNYTHISLSYHILFSILDAVEYIGEKYDEEQRV